MASFDLLQVLNRNSGQGDGNVVVSETIQTVVPKDAAVHRRKAEEMPLAAGKDVVFMEDHRDIRTVGGRKKTALQFGPPKFRAGGGFDRCHITVTSDEKMRLHVRGTSQIAPALAITEWAAKS